MAVTKIYYAHFDRGSFGDQVLYRERDLYSDEFAYAKCPVFNHKSNRTFVGVSPTDFTLRVDKSEVYSDDDSLVIFPRDHAESPLPVIQLKFPRFLFWTDEPNIWWEYKDHPMTSLNNNFIGIGGWFNLSEWPRMMSNSFTVVDPEKPVIIKKGDPLFRVCFYPPDLNSGIILEKVTDPKKIKEAEDYHSDRFELSNWKNTIFRKSKRPKTCPFKFLYNR